jgi:DNA-binding NarL/FixJ family response regulator
VEDDQAMRDRLPKVIANDPQRHLLYGPDVLLVDLGLADSSGTTVIAQRKKRLPAIEIMVLTFFGDETNMIGALEAGASGY